MCILLLELFSEWALRTVGGVRFLFGTFSFRVTGEISSVFFKCEILKFGL